MEEQKPEVKAEVKEVVRYVKTVSTYRFSKKLMEDFTSEPDLADAYRVREVKYDNAGNVLLETEFNEDGTISEKYERKYDEKGNSTEMCHFFESELAEKTSYHYNSNAQPEKEILHYADGSETVTSYSYDSENNLAEKKVVDSDGELESRETFKHSAKEIIEHCHYDAEGNLKESTKYFYDTVTPEKLKEEINYQAEHNIELRTVYLDDETGSITYNKEGKTHSRQKLIYDEKKRVTENVLETFNGRYYYVFGYDEKDNLISEERQLNGNIYFKVLNKWDENKLLLIRSVTDVNTGFFCDLFRYEFWE